MTPVSSERSALEGVDQTTAGAAAAVTLGAVIAATAIAWRYGSALPAQESILFLLNGLSAGAALTAAYILYLKAHAVEDQGLRWLALAYALGGFGIALQTAALHDLTSAGGGLGTTPSGIALQFLIFQAAFPTAAFLRPRRVPWSKWGPLGVAVSVAALLYAAWGGAPLPALVIEGDVYTPLFTALLLILAAYSAVALVSLLKDATKNLAWTEVWIAMSIVTGIGAIVFRALSATRFDDLWWASIASRTMQFVIPAVGFLASLGVLFRALDAHRRGLEERFRSEIHSLRNVAQVHISNEYLKREMIRQIDEVIDEGKLHPVFQPIVRLSNGKIVGAEALTRFETDVQISPQEWFENAARVGREIELESAASKAAVARFSELPEDCYLSLNTSPSALVAPDFRDLLSRLPLDRVVLEITEHALIDDYAKLNTILRALRRGGIRLAVDDAGAGFASFRHILRLNPDIIKLDVSLIRGIVDDPVRQSLATALVGFAHDLRATVVAEGIEEEAELELLIGLGIDCGQGYYLGRPGPLPLRSALEERVVDVAPAYATA